MTTADIASPFLTVPELAARLDRSERTAWARIARAGVTRYRDTAGRTLIAAADLARIDGPVPLPPP